jgi:hypothetical protein
MSVCTTPGLAKNLHDLRNRNHNPTTMAKLIAVLFLLAGGIKMTGYWAKYVQDQYSAVAMPFEESDSKCQPLDAKEKFEEDQAVLHYSAPEFNKSTTHTGYIFHSHFFASSDEEEPPCPPPNTSRS